MKILFARERYADGDMSKGLSDGSYMIPTARRAGHEVAMYHYDTAESVMDYDGGTQHVAEAAATPDEGMFAMASMFKPDLILFSHLLSWGERNIQKSTWATLKGFGIKVVGVWHEGVAPDVVRVADEHADVVDLNLFLDTKTQFIQYSRHPAKCFGLYDPRDSKMFVPLEKTRDIVFNGTLRGRTARIEGIANLLLQDFSVTICGGRQEMFLPEMVMVELLGQAKIVVNFSDAGNTGLRHYKGRVAEALLSGALLFELDNRETPTVLTAFQDYVSFANSQDLLIMANHYLRTRHGAQERARIAMQGRATALARLDGREFWASLTERLWVAT